MSAIDAGESSLSLAIEHVARVLSEWIIERHAAADPTLAVRYGENWRSDWVSSVHSRLIYLAQGIAVRSPALFSETMRWHATAFLARQIELRDLLQSLEHTRAVLAEELPPRGADLCAEYVTNSIDALRSHPPMHESAVDLSGPRSPLQARYLEALLNSRRMEAEEAILESARQGTPVFELFEQVLAPAQAELGRLWHRGEITVADEHFATATTISLIAQLRQRVPRPAAHGRAVTIASVGGDFHEVGLQFAAAYFEGGGWSVNYLGPNVPAPAILSFLRKQPTNILALSAGTSLFVRAVAEAIAVVRESISAKQIPILVAGPPFDLVTDLWENVGADGHARTFAEAPVLAMQLTRS